MAITEVIEELPEKVPDRFIVSHIIIKKKNVDNLQALNASYLQEAATYLKFNRQGKCPRGTVDDSFKCGEEEPSKEKELTYKLTISNTVKSQIYKQSKQLFDNFPAKFNVLHPNIKIIENNHIENGGIVAGGFEISLSGKPEIMLNGDADEIDLKILNESNIEMIKRTGYPKTIGNLDSLEKHFESIYKHEFGHYLLYTIAKQENPRGRNTDLYQGDSEWKSISQKLIDRINANEENVKTPSIYSWTNHSEMFAESFLAYELGKKDILDQTIIDYIEKKVIK